MEVTLSNPILTSSPASLPTEILLQILTHVLTAATPILNAGIFKSHHTGICTFEPRAGQQDITVVPSVCKRFNQLGHSIHHLRNHFVYTVAELHSPSHMWTNYPHCIQILTIRTTHNFTSRRTESSEAALEAIQWLSKFHHLQSLRIDFVRPGQFPRGVRPSLSNSPNGWLDSMEQKIRSLKPLSSAILNHDRGLQCLILTGLPCDIMSIALIKAFSHYVHPDGVVGLAYGDYIRRGYQYIDYSIRHAKAKHDSIYISAIGRSVVELRKRSELVGWRLRDTDSYTVITTPFDDNLRGDGCPQE